MEERLKTFFHLVKILFGIILLQCINLQILHFNYYRGLSEKNCIRTIDLGIPRGKIYDRNGRVLAEDKICFNLVYVPYDIKNPQEVASTLSDIFGFNKKDLLQQFNKSSSDPF